MSSDPTMVSSHGRVSLSLDSANTWESIARICMLFQQIYQTNKKSSQSFYWRNNHLIIWYCPRDGNLGQTADVVYFPFSITSIWRNSQDMFFLLICQPLKMVRMLSHFMLTLTVITMDQNCCGTANIHFRLNVFYSSL